MTNEESGLTVTVSEEVDHEAEISNLNKKLGDQGNEIGQVKKNGGCTTSTADSRGGR